MGFVIIGTICAVLGIVCIFCSMNLSRFDRTVRSKALSMYGNLLSRLDDNVNEVSAKITNIQKTKKTNTLTYVFQDSNNINRESSITIDADLDLHDCDKYEINDEIFILYNKETPEISIPTSTYKYATLLTKAYTMDNTDNKSLAQFGIILIVVSLAVFSLRYI